MMPVGSTADPRDRVGPARRIELSGGREIEYRDAGDGETILFVHAALFNGNMWRDVVPHLQHRRCVIPELPMGGHSLPMPPDADLSAPGIAGMLAEIMAALDLEDVTIVANDAGGAITQVLMTTRPERIARVVLTPCDTFQGFPPGVLAPLHRLRHVPGGVLTMLAISALPPISRAFFWSGAHRRIEPEVMETYRRPALADPRIRRDLIRFFSALDPRDTLEASYRLPDFDRPVLIVWGRHELWFPLRNARRLMELLPNARLEVLPKARTFLPEDAPERLAMLVDEFLETT